MIFSHRHVARDISHPSSATFRPSTQDQHRHQSQRVDGRFVHQHGSGARSSPHRTQLVRAEPMVGAHRMGASFDQRLSMVDHRIHQGRTQCRRSAEMVGRRRGKICAQSEGIVPRMRWHRFVDTPFVPDQPGGSRRATYIALRQSTGKRCTK